jgi:hypothetical protein
MTGAGPMPGAVVLDDPAANMRGQDSEIGGRGAALGILINLRTTKWL